ncbi:MAG: hypothetical protein AAF196_07345 [Planctomycetota bacterium]
MNLKQLSCVVLLAASMAAQDPVVQFGSASPADSAPSTRISTIGAPRVGNADFALRLEGAQPSSNAFLLLSSGHDSLVVENLEFLIELGPEAVCLGPIPVDADGVAECPLPIDPSESLLGTQLVAQWVSQNSLASSGLESTRAVRLTVVSSEFRLFVSTSGELQLRDEGGELDSFSFSTPNSSSTLAVRADGRVAAVGLVEPNATPQIRWFEVGTSTLTDRGATPISGTVVQVAIHPVTGELYSYSGQGGLSPSVFTVRSFESDPDAQNFMAQTNEIEVIGGLGVSMGFSPSGDQLILASAFSFQVIDTDPDSETNGEVVLTRTTNLQGFGIVSASGETFFTLPVFSTELLEFGVATGVQVGATTLADDPGLFGTITRAPGGELAIVRAPGTEIFFFDPIPPAGAPRVTSLPNPRAIGFLTGVEFSLDGARVFGFAGIDLVELDRATAIEVVTPTTVTGTVSGLAVR